MIIVTGGAGFIGSCFIQKLNQMGKTDVVVVDNIGSTNKWKNLLNKSFTNYYDKNTFREQILSGRFDNNHSLIKDSGQTNKDIEYIFHFGACSSTTEQNFNYLLENNFEYSKMLFEYSKQVGAKFIYASSAATYGLGELGYTENLNKELRPLNAYGYSKLLFDQWLETHGELCNTLALKFFNVFGPNEYHKNSMASMVYKAYNQIQETNSISLFKSNTQEFEDGGQLRDFVYIKDAVDLVWLLAETNIKGIFNVGTGKARTWNELAKSVFESLGKKEHINYIDMPEHISKQYQNFTEADLSKFQNLIDNKTITGFSFRTLEESIKDYVLNYLKKDWQYL